MPALAFLLSAAAPAQDLPSRWDELVASDWSRALEASNKTCVLPFGVLEKHGPHAPIGADVIKVREVAARATKREYAVVFPDYYFGQINEAKHQPGTFAVPPRVAWDLLEATCDEIARNGFKRIVILNGHGGNPEMIYYFGQTRLEKRRDYALYFYTPQDDPAFEAKIGKTLKSDPSWNLHAGENESAWLLYLRPDTMKPERAPDESGTDAKRLTIPPDLWTPIWWYARFPNHYAGEGGKATRELGQALVEHQIERFAKALKAVKADTRTLELQDEYFSRSEKKDP
jgi:creatinine amidohydrolase